MKIFSIVRDLKYLLYMGRGIPQYKKYILETFYLFSNSRKHDFLKQDIEINCLENRPRLKVIDISGIWVSFCRFHYKVLKGLLQTFFK